MGSRTPQDVHAETNLFLPPGVNDVSGWNCLLKGLHLTARVGLTAASSGLMLRL